MIKLKASGLTQIGFRHIQNDDSVFLNENEGIYILCDGVSEGGQGKLASEKITQVIQEKLIQANQRFKEHSSELAGTKRLQAMQEVMQNTFADAQSSIRADAENNPRPETPHVGLHVSKQPPIRPSRRAQKVTERQLRHVFSRNAFGHK